MESTEKNKFSDFFASRLRALMEERGITQKTLASECDVSQPAVHGWLQGVQPKAYEIYRLGRIFGVQPLFLIFDDAPSQLPMEMREKPSEDTTELALWKRRAETAEEERDQLQAKLNQIIVLAGRAPVIKPGPRQDDVVYTISDTSPKRGNVLNSKPDAAGARLLKKVSISAPKSAPK